MGSLRTGQKRSPSGCTDRARRFARRALERGTWEQLAKLIAEEGRCLAAADAAVVVLHAGENHEAVAAGLAAPPKSGAWPQGMIRRAVRTGQAAAWPLSGRPGPARRDERLWRRDLEWLRLRREPGRAYLLPLGLGKPAAGVLILLGNRRAPWSARLSPELAWLGTAAGMALAAFAQRHRFERRIRQATAVSEIAQNINTTLDTDILLRLIILEITKAMGCQAGDIWMRPDRRQEVKFQVGLGLSPAARGLALAGGCTLQALTTGEPVSVIEANLAPAANPEALAREGIASLAAVPLKTKNRVIGVMHLFARQPRAFSREDVMLLKTLTAQAALAIENAQLFNETKRKAQELLGLYEVAQVISEMSNLHSALEQIVERVGGILNVEKCWFLFWDEQRRELAAQTAAVGAEEEQLAALRFGRDGAGVSAQVFRTARPFYSNDAENEPAVLADFKNVFRLRNIMAVPLRGREQTLGVFFAGNKRDGGSFTGNDVRLFRTLASEATVVIQNAGLYDKLRRSYLSIVQVISEMVDARERYTRGHSERVSAYAALIAHRLKLPSEQVECVTVAGLLHDIGKIGIAERILLKPARLNHREYTVIQNHPSIGEHILRGVEMPWDVLPAIRHHHERFDGRGYPDRLAGEAIPLGARILAAADAFDVITTHRVYQRARSREAGFAELEREAGKQFDPAVVKAFCEAMRET